MNANKFVSRVLRVEHMPKEPITVTVTRTLEEEFGRKDEPKESKLVLYFKEIDQGWAVPRTVIPDLIDIFGDEMTEKWVGKRLVLFVDPEVKYGSKKVGGIRARKA